MKHYRWKWLSLGLLLVALVSCSPEDGRPRGAGLGTGADVNNYRAVPTPKSKLWNTQKP